MKRTRRRKGEHPRPLALLKWQRHRALAKFRDIDFNMDFDTWDTWWQQQGVDKNVKTAWGGGNRLCMCRFNDSGPYELGNIYCATNAVNASHQGAPKASKYQYRWGINTYSAHEFTLAHPEIKPSDRWRYRADQYDANRASEMRRLVNGYQKHVGTHMKRRKWVVGGVEYNTRPEAIAASDLTRNQFVWRDQNGKLPIVYTGPTLREWVDANTRYPDPIYPQPEDIPWKMRPGEFDK